MFKKVKFRNCNGRIRILRFWKTLNLDTFLFPKSSLNWIFHASLQPWLQLLQAKLPRGVN